MGALGKLKWHVQLLIVALVCGGALGAVWYFVLSPISVEIEAKSKQVADLQAKVDKTLALKASAGSECAYGTPGSSVMISRFASW